MRRTQRIVAGLPGAPAEGTGLTLSGTLSDAVPAAWPRDEAGGPAHVWKRRFVFALDCRFCRHDNPAGAKYCNRCGAPLELKSCEACDAVNARSATHCRKCGCTFEPQPPASSLAAPAGAPHPRHSSGPA